MSYTGLPYLFEVSSQLFIFQWIFLKKFGQNSTSNVIRPQPPWKAQVKRYHGTVSFLQRIQKPWVFLENFWGGYHRVLLGGSDQYGYQHLQCITMQIGRWYKKTGQHFQCVSNVCIIIGTGMCTGKIWQYALSMSHCTSMKSLSISVRPKPGFGIGNRNQGPISVSVS